MRIRHFAGSRQCVCAVAVVLFSLFLGVAPTLALSTAQTASPKQQASPTAPPVATVIQPPRATAPPISATAAPAPVATSTPAPARTDRPLTGLVLVPASSRVGPATPGNAADLTAVRGQVLDATGKGLWGQTVKVVGAGGVQVATTNDAGYYEVDGLVPGVYTVVVDQQICTPAENLRAPAGGGVEVDFAQIKTASTAVVAMRTATPGTPTPTRTPRPAELPPTPTATPRPSPTPISLSSWWGWIGFDIDFAGLWSSLFLGVLGGAAFVALGIVIRIVRR
ncbi:MAG: carboxypeptidase-like regulatory domain-containing protein [Chloroflexota bacterium]